MYLQLQNFASAVADYTRAIEIDAQIWMAYNGRSKALVSLGKTTEAIRDLEQVAKLNAKMRLEIEARIKALSER